MINDIHDPNILNYQLKKCWDKQISHFNDNENKKKQLKKQVQQIDDQMSIMMNNTSQDESIMYAQLMSKKEQLLNEIDLINSNFEQKVYIANANQLIQDYDVLGDVTDDEQDELQYVNDYYDDLNKNSQVIYYHQQQKTKDKKYQDETLMDNFENLNKKQEDIIKRKNIIKQLYDDWIDKSTKIKKQITNKCINCHQERIKHNDYVICEGCGIIEQFLVQSEQCSKTKVEKQKYPYKRINHLIEWLNQLQAKENIYIPNQVYMDLLGEVQKHRLTHTYQFTYRRIKQFLKKLHYNQYYEHIPYIISNITGQPAPALTKQQEDEVKQRFKMIQEPFDKYRPGNRVNFMSYSFILSKLFRLAGINKYVSYFALLKSKQKLWQQDLIWQKICEDLDWKFIPSI